MSTRENIHLIARASLHNICQWEAGSWWGTYFYTKNNETSLFVYLQSEVLFLRLDRSQAY